MPFWLSCNSSIGVQSLKRLHKWLKYLSFWFDGLKKSSSTVQLLSISMIWYLYYFGILVFIVFQAVFGLRDPQTSVTNQKFGRFVVTAIGQTFINHDFLEDCLSFTFLKLDFRWFDFFKVSHELFISWNKKRTL